jgi:hypothetical protein
MESLRAAGWKSSVAALIMTSVLAVAPRVGAQLTETPWTIQPGSLVAQADLMSLALERQDPNQADKPFSAQVVARTLLATGLTRDLDVQVGLEWFLREKFNLHGREDSSSGVGALSLRSKYTFWSDQSGGAAAAVEPYVRIPTRRAGVGSGAVEGGVIVPWAQGTPGGTTVGAMAEWDFVRNDNDTGYDSIWHVAGLASLPIMKSFSLYGEAALGVSSAGASDWAFTAGAGATWLLTDHTRLDCSMHRYVAHGANSWNPVVRLRHEF